MLFNMSGGGSGATFVTLWENANYTSSFSGQSLTIPTDGYNLFVVETSDGTFFVTYKTAMSYATQYEGSTSYVHFPSRTVTIYDGTATFTDCYQFRLGGSSNSVYAEKLNSRFIPYRILGVKGVPAWE